LEAAAGAWFVAAAAVAAVAEGEAEVVPLLLEAAAAVAGLKAALDS
jgi:hypothetical protein